MDNFERGNCVIYKKLPELIVITSGKQLSFEVVGRNTSIQQKHLLQFSAMLKSMSIREAEKADRIILIHSINSGKYEFFYFKNRNGKTGIFIPTQDVIEELTELLI